MAMKKVLHITLAALLLFASVGMSTTSHYCGDFLMEVVAGQHEDLSCCGMMNCCSNEVEHFSLEDDYQYSPDQTDFSTHYTCYFTLPLAPHSQPLILPSIEAGINQRANAPPPASAPPIYLLAQVFRC